MNEILKQGNDILKTMSGAFAAQNVENMQDLRKLLHSSFEVEKIAALRQLITLMDRNIDISALYPDVVMNITCALETRQLVHIILIKLSHAQPDIALLSVNSLQKDMADQNPIIRSTALRVLSQLNVPMLITIIELAIKKATTDLSPIVRKAAAEAISQVYILDATYIHVLKELLQPLLSDKSPLVLGSAITTFNYICPENFDFIHPHFHKIASAILDCDEWDQIEIVQMYMRYSRAHFFNPSTGDLHPDLLFVLERIMNLLFSSNIGVIQIATTFVYYLAPTKYLEKSANALIRCLSFALDDELLPVLILIRSIALKVPNSFSSKYFYIYPDESPEIQKLKLDILLILKHEYQLIFNELLRYTKYENKELSINAIKAIGKIGCADSNISEKCMTALLKLTKKNNDDVIGESIVAIRLILEKMNHFIPKILPILVYFLPTATPRAKESIYWIYSEYHGISAECKNWALDILRLAIISFSKETTSVKLQILNFGYKLKANSSDSKVEILVQYLNELSQFDPNYDVRDKARLLKSLSQYNSENLKHILNAPKLVNLLDTIDNDTFTVGSMSHYLNKPVCGYQPIKEFPTVLPICNRSSLTQPETIQIIQDRSSEIRRVVKLEDFYQNSESESSSDESLESNSDSTDKQVI